MMIFTCDGCRRRIADDDPQAARRLPLGGERVDWCGDCVTIVRAICVRWLFDRPSLLPPIWCLMNNSPNYFTGLRLRHGL